MCREVVKRATNWWIGNTARRYNPQTTFVQQQEELEELQVIARAYAAAFMARSDAEEHITRRRLIDYFDLVA
jgi:hypothetical protein